MDQTTQTVQLLRPTGIAISGHRPQQSTICCVMLLSCASALWALLSGCAFLQPRDDPTRFYVLTALKAQTDRATEEHPNRRKVGLLPVEVPAYLRSTAIAVRTGANEVHFGDFDRWAEPLDQGIGRVLMELLSSARNVEAVVLVPHGDDTLDCEVALRILACEGERIEDGRIAIRFAATWEVRSVGQSAAVIKRDVFTAEPAWDGASYGQLAERLSEVLASLSKAIAADLSMEPEPPRQTPTDGAREAQDRE